MVSSTRSTSSSTATGTATACGSVSGEEIGTDGDTGFSMLARPAQRAGDVVLEPGVDAVRVEHVGALRQQLELIAVVERGQAQGAL